MRKIEQAMIAAIKDGRNWSSGNTRVEHNLSGSVGVFLCNNHIAHVSKDNDLKISLAGWNTPMCRSRLTALCQAFTRCNGVSTKLGQAALVYAKDITGEPRNVAVIQPITNTQWVEV